MSLPVVEAKNVFAGIQAHLDDELIDVILQGDNVRVERIVSQGHTSPDSGWYDQEQDEWVIVLQGEAVIAYPAGDEVRLAAGDYITIPAHVRHKVQWTSPSVQTVWLAVFY